MLSEGTTPLWDSKTAGKSSAAAIMQADGNFVIYDTAGNPIWDSHKLGSSYWLAVQGDGNLVVYNASASSSNKVVWQTYTCCH